MIPRQRILELLIQTSGSTPEEMEKMVGGSSESGWAKMDNFVAAVKAEPDTPIKLARDTSGVLIGDWRIALDQAVKALTKNGNFWASEALYEICQYLSTPLDLVCFCPRCGAQHIDRAEIEPTGEVRDGATVVRYTWDNPPHKSHLCHNCKYVWRPADFPTNGVQTTNTRGQADTEPFGGEQRRRTSLVTMEIKNFDPLIKVKLTRKLGNREMLEVTDVFHRVLCDVPMYVELVDLFGDRPCLYFTAKFMNGFLTLQDNILPSEFK